MKILPLDALKNMSESELASQYNSADTEISTILKEIGDDVNPPESKMSDISNLEEYIQNIDKVAGDRREAADNLKGIRERSADRSKNLALPTHRPGQSVEADMQYAKSLGEKLIAGAENYLKSIRKSDGSVRDVRIQSEPVAVQGLMKALVTGASNTSAGALIANDRFGTVTNRDPFRKLTLRDMITVGETTSDAVDLPIITGHTNNAAPVAEATDSAGTTGTPAESDMALKVETINVKDISHYVTITKRALADAGQVKTFTDSFLEWGLADKLERQMLVGDGTGENLLGIRNATGLKTQAYDTDIFTTARKARTQLTNINVEPTAWLMSPAQWETFDLSKDLNGAYRFGGPSVLGNPRLWATTVIENSVLENGVGLLGDYRYAMLFDRMAAELTMSDSPNNYWLRKLVAIMGSLRAAFGVLFPGAFVEVDFTP